VATSSPTRCPSVTRSRAVARPPTASCTRVRLSPTRWRRPTPASRPAR
jgi:hypothetical protein